MGINLQLINIIGISCSNTRNITFLKILSTKYLLSTNNTTILGIQILSYESLKYIYSNTSLFN